MKERGLMENREGKAWLSYSSQYFEKLSVETVKPVV